VYSSPNDSQLIKTASIYRTERRKTKIEIREVAIIVVIAEWEDGGMWLWRQFQGQSNCMHAN
jgi:hypothetical protein